MALKKNKLGIEMRTYWDTFEGSYQMGKQKHRMFLLNMLKEKGVTSILDSGCGTGPIYEIIRDDKMPFKYKGTDYSPTMTAVCKQLFPEGDFETEDARKLTEKDNSWDCVLLLHCLDHLDDYESAIKESARVASKYVCVVLWRPFVAEGTRLNDRNMFCKEEGEDPWEDTHFQEYSKEALEEAFKKAGLTIEEEIGDDRLNDPGKYNYLYLLKKTT